MQTVSRLSLAVVCAVLFSGAPAVAQEAGRTDTQKGMSVTKLEPVDVVKSFLAAMSRRDFAAMEALMAPGFRMTVTGGATYTHPKEFAANSSKRQKSARKTTDSYDVMPTAKGAVVYSIGSMAGEWNNGTTYKDVRYIDRFEIENGQIVDMQVYSDMAEFRPKD